MKYFTNFLYSLKNKKNDSVIEAILKGYRSLFENIEYQWGTEPKYKIYKQLTAIENNSIIGFVIFDEKPNNLYIEKIETNKNRLREGIASNLINKLKAKFPKH